LLMHRKRASLNAGLFFAWDFRGSHYHSQAGQIPHWNAFPGGSWLACDSGGRTKLDKQADPNMKLLS